MTTTPTCLYCGRPVSPCANCGGVHGEMVRVHGKWIHRRQVDCIVHLRARLSAIENQPAALPTTPAPAQEPTP